MKTHFVPASNTRAKPALSQLCFQANSWEKRAMASIPRRTVELSAYPDLVVIYLGMRVNALTEIKTTEAKCAMFSARGRARRSGEAKSAAPLTEEQLYP
jgi:hypothetical protein